MQPFVITVRLVYRSLKSLKVPHQQLIMTDKQIKKGDKRFDF